MTTDQPNVTVMHIFVSTSALPTLHPFLKAHWSQALHCSAAGSNFHPAKFDHFWGTHSNLVETAILSDTLLTVPDRSYCFMCSVKYVAPHYILSVAWCLTPFIKSAPLETTFNAFQVANTREKVSFVNKKKKKKRNRDGKLRKTTKRVLYQLDWLTIIRFFCHA